MVNLEARKTGGAPHDPFHPIIFVGPVGAITDYPSYAMHDVCHNNFG